MNRRGYKKALLLAKIDAHRSVFGLELKLARANFHPLSTLASLLGIDRHLIEVLMPLLHLAKLDLRPPATEESTPSSESSDKKDVGTESPQ